MQPMPMHMALRETLKSGTIPGHYNNIFVKLYITGELSAWAGPEHKYRPITSSGLAL